MNACMFRLTAVISLFAASAVPATTLANGQALNTRLLVSLPPGGCMLLVFPDGSGRLHYGAAPRTVQVAARTFDFDKVLQSLRSGMQDRAPEAHDDARPIAGVSFPGTNVVERFHDVALVRSLLETGWKSRLPPTDIWHEDAAAHAVIGKTCRFD